MLTMVDSLNIVDQLATPREARLQVALADLLVMTKLDMLDAAARAERFDIVMRELRAINPVAPILLRDQVLPSAALLDLASGQSSNIGMAAEKDAGHGHDHEHHHDHDVSRHGDRIRAAVLTLAKPMRRQAVEMFCELMTTAHATSLLRLKGLVSVEGSRGPLVLHAVHGIMHEPVQMEDWPDENRQTRIVVILQDQDPDFVRRLLAAFADIPMSDTPDSTALTNNPLGIPGYAS
jgi:G3E family GTPase